MNMCLSYPMAFVSGTAKCTAQLLLSGVWLSGAAVGVVAGSTIKLTKVVTGESESVPSDEIQPSVPGTHVKSSLTDELSRIEKQFSQFEKPSVEPTRPSKVGIFQNNILNLDDELKKLEETIKNSLEA
ncbi:MAG: hypothetical protein HQK83_13025 [Fibrobacteria bacterium]|nr:hypothetical protein [Fibrobacteria bacterium]